MGYLILVPGIGGHPDFHADLLRELCTIDRLKVISFPHGDFFLPPFHSLGQHIEYWSGILRNQLEATNDPVHVLGISYGCTITQSLPKSLLAKVSSIGLVSPVLLSGALKATFRLAKSLDCRVSATLFGKFLFRWSELQSADVPRLVMVREQLYDNHSDVYARLWRRFLSIGQSREAEGFFAATGRRPVYIICGENEWLRRSASRHIPELPGRVWFDVIPGNHAQSINKSSELVRSIRRNLENIHELDI